jgi:hypothetical protein
MGSMASRPTSKQSGKRGGGWLKKMIGNPFISTRISATAPLGNPHESAKTPMSAIRRIA